MWWGILICFRDACHPETKDGLSGLLLPSCPSYDDGISKWKVLDQSPNKVVLFLTSVQSIINPLLSYARVHTHLGYRLTFIVLCQARV